MNLRKVVLVTLVIPGTFLGCGGSANPASSPSSGTGSDATASSGTSEASASDTSSSSKAASGTTATVEIATGMQTRDKRSASLDFDLNLSKKGAGSGIQHGEWSFAEERTLRVKKAKDNRVVELEVVYGKWEAKPLLGLSYEVPTNDKTYILSSEGKLSITQGGKKVSSAEETAVSDEYGWVGSQSPLTKALLDAKLAPETNLSASPQIAAALLGAIPGVDIARAAIIASIKSVKTQPRKTATLEVSGTFSIKSKKTVFDIELKGPADVDVATGWILSMDLKGTAAIAGQTEVPKKGTMDVEGKGKFTISRQSEFK